MTSQSPNTFERQDRQFAAGAGTPAGQGGRLLGFTAFLALAAVAAVLSAAPPTTAAPNSVEDLPADECDKLWEEYWDCELSGADDCVKPDCGDSSRADDPSGRV